MRDQLKLFCQWDRTVLDSNDSFVIMHCKCGAVLKRVHSRYGWSEYCKHVQQHSHWANVRTNPEIMAGFS